MEILQLLSSLIGEDNVKAIKPLFELLKNNDFNLFSVIKNLTPETLSPFLKFFSQNESRTNFVRQDFGLTPILSIADNDILYNLNKYLED